MEISNLQKKQLKLFLIITFVVTYGMGIIMGVGFKLGKPTELFVNTQMLYPAAAVMLTVLLTKGKDENIPRKFYYCFLVITVVLMILSILLLFLDEKIIYIIFSNVFSIGAIICWICYFLDEKEKRISYGLKFNKISDILYLILFFMLYAIVLILSNLISGTIGEFFKEIGNIRILQNFLLILPGIFLSFTAFFGEEYGWRYFLQPLMQKKFGNYKGIILVGMIWGIWHLPVNIFLYSPETWILSVINQQIVCIGYGIFFGFVYMKTKNIWLPTLIHYFNNNLVFVLTGSTDISNQVLTWQGLLLSAVVFGIVYIPFILSKEYKKRHDNLGILYENAEIVLEEINVEK